MGYMLTGGKMSVGHMVGIEATLAIDAVEGTAFAVVGKKIDAQRHS